MPSASQSSKWRVARVVAVVVGPVPAQLDEHRVVGAAGLEAGPGLVVDDVVRAGRARRPGRPGRGRSGCRGRVGRGPWAAQYSGSRVGGCGPQPVPEEQGHQGAEDEPADVGHPGHARGRVGEELEDEPEAEQPLGRDVADEDEEEDEQGPDAHVGEEHQVGAHHPGDRARGPDHGDGAVGLDEDVGRAGHQPRDQVEADVRRRGPCGPRCCCRRPRGRACCRRCAAGCRAGTSSRAGPGTRACRGTPAGVASSWTHASVSPSSRVRVISSSESGSPSTTSHGMAA